MAEKSNLPAVVHDHFRKANKLHGYVEKELGEARNHALEIGDELLAAKKLTPHGRWEDECKRLFDGSPRTAQFYMRFTRDFGKLKSAGQSALLMLEGTLDGAAKAAKKATKPPAPKPPKPKPDPPETDEPIEADSESVDAPDCDVCNDTGVIILSGLPCGGCSGEDDSAHPPLEPPKRNETPPKQYPGSHWFKQYQQAIGPLCRIVDKIAEGFGDSPTGSQKVVQDHLQLATDEMQEWLGCSDE